MTKTLSEILGFGQPSTPMTPADRAAEKEKKKEEREKAKKQQAATREKRQNALAKERAANKAAKKERHDARKEKQGNRQVKLARQNANGAERRSRAMKNRQERRAGVATRAAVNRNTSRVKFSQAKTTTAYKTAANAARYYQDRVKANLQTSSTEYDMSTVEIISESCMVGLNEDMYFKVKIEGLPTMYVNSANREELRKDLVGLLRNPSKAVGDIKRVTPQEVKKRLRLRSQGKEEEEMNEAQINKMKFVSKGFTSRKEAERHNDTLVGSGKASQKSYVHDHKDGKFYVVDTKAKVLQSSTNVSEATADVINKLKEYYMNESKAYYTGLSKSTADDRKRHFKRHGPKDDDDNSAYKPAPGDATAKTKPSKHTKKAEEMGMGPGPKNEAGPGLWANIHAKRKRGERMRKKGEKGAPTPEAIRSAQKESYNINENKKGLQNKAEKSGMPLGVLKQVYNRGMAAWKTGHRPGTTPEQWGMARVNSFITKSSGTWGKADKDLAAKVKK